MLRRRQFTTSSGQKKSCIARLLGRLTEDIVDAVHGFEIPAGVDFERSIAELTSRLWQTVLDQTGKHRLLNELSVSALRSSPLRDVLRENRDSVELVTAGLIDATAQHFGVTPAVETLYLARYFLSTFDGLALRHMSIADPEFEDWCLASLVESTIALVHGQLRTQSATV